MPLARPALLALALSCAPAAPGAAQQGLKLAFPVDCKLGETCEIQNYFDRDPAAGAAADYRCGGRARDGGSGLDVRLPDRMIQAAGITVLAAAPGRVIQARDGLPDFAPQPGAKLPADPCGDMVVIDHGGGWETRYCHLAPGSVAVKPGQRVEAGAAIARVGQSGVAAFPHLQFEVRRQGTPVDPFAPDAAARTCQAKDPLWDRAALRRMSYRPVAVLNAGFTGDPSRLELMETTPVPPPAASDRGVVAYVRTVGLEKGDLQELTVKGPSGRVVAGAYPRPLETPRPDNLIFVGKARQAESWPRGGYTATYVVRRGGKVVLQRVFKTTL